MTITTECDLLWLADQRQSDQPQIWVAGCSIANGTDVEKTERYGQLLADELNMPVSFLSILGSAIPWAADQILRSDIRQGDIVVWGLTGISRYLTFRNNIFVNVLPETFLVEIDPISFALRNGEDRQQVLDYYVNYQKGIDSWTGQETKEMESACLNSDRLMQAVQTIHQVNNFCNKIGAKLIVFLHDISLEEYYDFVEERISNLPGYLKISEVKDMGKHGTHPGPKTHQTWTDEILEKLKNL